MRIAIISDIHSNLEALTAVLQCIDGEHVDEILCLGDIIGYGANPEECLSLVQERCRFIIKGNHEAAVVQTRMTVQFHENARNVVLWTRRKLSTDQLRFLSQLPTALVFKELLFVHASPRLPDQFEYITNDMAARSALQAYTEPLCFIGHTHRPELYSTQGRIVDLHKNERALINVGSVGQPRDGNPRASFGLFDTERWSYDNIRVPYDIEKASQKILKANLPSALAQRLFLGV